MPGRVSPTTAKSKVEIWPPFGPTLPTGCGPPLLDPADDPELEPAPELEPVVDPEPPEPQLQTPLWPLQGSAWVQPPEGARLQYQLPQHTVPSGHVSAPELLVEEAEACSEQQELEHAQLPEPEPPELAPPELLPPEVQPPEPPLELWLPAVLPAVLPEVLPAVLPEVLPEVLPAVQPPELLEVPWFPLVVTEPELPAEPVCEPLVPESSDTQTPPLAQAWPAGQSAVVTQEAPVSPWEFPQPTNEAAASRPARRRRIDGRFERWLCIRFSFTGSSRCRLSLPASPRIRHWTAVTEFRSMESPRLSG